MKPPAIVLIVASALSLAAHAGPISPPPGPVVSTHKTLSEVEPRIAINAINTRGDANSTFKITQPGSYYLTGNITGEVGKHGIEIVASGVTVDLNGFDMVGVPGMGAFNGVCATENNLTNIAVVNGSLRSWGADGVDIGSWGERNCRVDRVLASGNADKGINVSDGSTVTHCSAYNNAGIGIFAGNGSTIANCTAYDNAGNGISSAFGSTISNCTAYGNGGNGLSSSSGCTITSCTAYDNDGSGISTSNGSTVTHCLAQNNAVHGIVVNAGSTVADCTARLNTLNGIACAVGCVIRDNTCANNGNGAGDGAGIHATGADNRIESNNCISADRGIDVDVAGNIIVRNTCSGNATNWDIVANNVVGPIIDRTAPGSAAISGNSAPSSLGTTDPNANFTY